MTDMATESQATSRPIGVTILATLAAIALALSVLHLLQALGIVPYFIGPVTVRDFNLWYVLMWGLLVWIWVWAVQALWNVDPAAWLFVLVISAFNLLFDFFTLIDGSTAGTTYNDVAVSFVVNLVVLGYVLLPGTKRSFGVP